MLMKNVKMWDKSSIRCFAFVAFIYTHALCLRKPIAVWCEQTIIYNQLYETLTLDRQTTNTTEYNVLVHIHNTVYEFTCFGRFTDSVFIIMTIIINYVSYCCVCVWCLFRCTTIRCMTLGLMSHMAFTLPKLLSAAITILDFDICTKYRWIFRCVRMNEWIGNRDGISHRLYAICVYVLWCLYQILLAKMTFTIINGTFQQYLVLRLPNSKCKSQFENERERWKRRGGSQ